MLQQNQIRWSAVIYSVHSQKIGYKELAYII